MTSQLIELQIFHLRLPFRGRFAHAAAQRASTDTVVVAALLADGTVGFGEGLGRPYVTGETPESVVFNTESCLTDWLNKQGKIEPQTFSDILEIAYHLPFRNEQGQIINAARCGVELALLDAYGKYFQCDMSSIIGYLGYGGFSHGGSIESVRVSGVLDGSDPEKVMRRMRLMRWFGLRDFKLKVGCEHDDENLRLIWQRYNRQLGSGAITLRVDANGAWDIDTATAMSEKLARQCVCCIEQPLAPSDHDHWNALASLSHISLMADESLVTVDDAQYLLENDLVDYFNIRISKNGGLMPAIRLAEMAFEYSRGYQLGAMVGETGILAGAGRQFLQLVPNTCFTEICYGTLLLKDDIVSSTVRFGYGGRMKKFNRPGLGVSVRRDMISKFVVEKPRKIQLS